MLKKLGWRLTLVNALISSAILLAMALTSLWVVERMMERQNENDLLNNTRAMLSAMQETKTGGVALRVQLPEKYRVLLDGEDSQQRQLISPNVEVTDAESVLPELKGTFIFKDTSEGDASGVRYYATRTVNRTTSLDIESGEDDELDVKVAIVPDAAGETDQPMAVAYTMSGFTTSTLDGVPYRMSVTLLGGDEQSDNVMFVMQDRTQELNERDFLRVLFACCVGGGLLLITFASLWMSKRAIVPVERSIRQQQEFVSAASHELRTPVAAMRANAEVLLDAPLGEYQPFLGSILSESEKMSALITDLLNLARADAGQLKLEPVLVDAAEVARDALALVAPLMEQAGLRLESEIQPALIMGDPDRLRQVLIALLDNTARYTPEGGEVRLSVKKAGHQAQIRVEDTGPGIEDAHKQRVFDRFYRIDTARSRASGGAGLGLSISKQLVELMNGSIRLSDRPGGGCVFTLTFAGVE